MSQIQYPGYWRYAWMHAMQPLLLHQINMEHHIDANVSTFRLWRSGEPKNIWIQTWLKRNGFTILVYLPMMFIFLLLFFPHLNSLKVSLIHGAVAAAIGLSMSVILSFTVSIHAGIDALTRVMMAVFAFAFATSNMIVGSVVGVLYGVGIGVYYKPTWLSNHSNGTFWLYPTVAMRQLIANLNPYWMKPPILDYDHLCFPIPFLKSGTMRLAERDPQLAQEVLEACARSSGCEDSARHILEQLQAQELILLAESGDWTRAAELKGTWLMGRENASPSLLGFGETARFILEASHQDDADQELKHLGQAKAHLAKHQLYLKFNSNRQNLLLLSTTLPIWERVMTHLFENSASVYLGK